MCGNMKKALFGGGKHSVILPVSMLSCEMYGYLNILVWHDLYTVLHGSSETSVRGMLMFNSCHTCKNIQIVIHFTESMLILRSHPMLSISLKHILYSLNIFTYASDFLCSPLRGCIKLMLTLWAFSMK